MEEPESLERYFRGNDGPLVHKWLHYFPIYERHFARFRGRPITMLEIGVFHGGSLAMWSDYFGQQARIIGVDIDDRVTAFETGNVEICIGDQEDPEFLGHLAAEYGPFDIVLDDGGHTTAQQLATFQRLWPAMKRGGVFLVEDLHTNYWGEFGGGLRKPDTFIEFAKGLVDSQNAWHARDSSPPVDGYTTTISGIHSYDSIMVFDRDELSPPQDAMSGRPAFHPLTQDPMEPLPLRSSGAGDPAVLATQIWQTLAGRSIHLEDERLHLTHELQARAAEIRSLESQLHSCAEAKAQLAKSCDELRLRERDLEAALANSRETVAALRRRLPDRIKEKVNKVRGKTGS